MDTPIERLARCIRDAQKEGDTLKAIAKRAGLPSYQRLQSILRGSDTTDFIPVCAALGLDPMKIWYGGGGEPFDISIRKILDTVQDWDAKERAALVEWVQKFRPSTADPTPRKLPGKKQSHR